jgi:hypothetical protein
MMSWVTLRLASDTADLTLAGVLEMESVRGIELETDDIEVGRSLLDIVLPRGLGAAAIAAVVQADSALT